MGHFHACVVCASEHDVHFENNLVRSALRAQRLSPGFGAFFALCFHACVACASEHDVYFENSSMSAGDRAPLLNARHEDGRGETPARAERVLLFHACVVCASEHEAYFENSPLYAGAGVPPSPSAKRSTQRRARAPDCVGADTGPSRTGPAFSCLRGVRQRT